MANNYVYSKRNGDIPETMNLVIDKLAQIALEMRIRQDSLQGSWPSTS